MITRLCMASETGLIRLSVIAIGLLGSFAVAQGNRPARPEETKTLSRQKVAELLRQPNGLAMAANLVGKFVISGQGHLWSHTTLPNVVASSNLIVVGKITSRLSRLSEDGDDIYTDYTVEVERVIKGKASGSSASFTVHGGLIEFPNGTSAQVTTVEWQQLQMEQRYALLLRQEQDGRFYPANGLEALFRLSTPNEDVDALAAHDGKRHVIADEVKGLTASAFVAKLEAFASAKATQ